MVKTKKSKKIVKWYDKPRFKRNYAFFAVATLIVSTIFWSFLGAKLQQGNADQLVNSYLFENLNTFHNALFPGPHTFLLKWPLFLLIKVLKFSNPAFIGVTVAISLITVLALAYLLHRIERRPLVFGTICLALASVLVMIPAQPYSGALLPVNMAMIATRNLEYILFIGSLVILFRWPKVKSLGFWLGATCLALVIASDKLFLTLSLGGTLMALLVYAFTQRTQLTQISVKWLTGGIFAALLATAILWGINASGLTHISNQGTAGAYGFVNTLPELAKAITYGILGFITNFGANPAFDGLIVRDMPSLAVKRLLSVGGLSFVVNLAVMLACFFASVSLLLQSISRRSRPKLLLDRAQVLALMLTWATIASFGAFIITKHYYVADARYLGIALFSMVVSGAVYSRRIQWQPKRIVQAGVVLSVSVLLGSIFSYGIYQDQSQGLRKNNERNSLIGQALLHHPVDTLVGDYWRVMPAKQTAAQPVEVMPLDGCTQARKALSSQAWESDLKKNSFAYLLSLDPGLTDYPNCKLDDIVKAYGRPNASAVISGNVDNPLELLLFYDSGIHASSPATVTKQVATVLPIPLEELPNTSCSKPTIMNIVAHQDDDLIFMNPDLQKDIKAGHCVRTVYVTAGDAGSDEFYWLSREKGSEAAYSKMIGDDGVWVQRIVKLDEKLYVTVANPRNNPNISIVFLRLPDGNMKGQGFSGSHHQSLEQLNSGAIAELTTVTKQSTYTANQLTETLSRLMSTYRPTEIRTQSTLAGDHYTDHSDHMTVGRFAKQAYEKYETRQFEGRLKVPFKYYIGYPVHERPKNLEGDELSQKEAAFFAYAKYDGGVCQTMEECLRASTLGGYLERQYENTY